jgi:hypothetical protein
MDAMTKCVVWMLFITIGGHWSVQERSIFLANTHNTYFIKGKLVIYIVANDGYKKNKRKTRNKTNEIQTKPATGAERVGAEAQTETIPAASGTSDH